jgi:hypothetical protein
MYRGPPRPRPTPQEPSRHTIHSRPRPPPTHPIRSPHRASRRPIRLRSPTAAANCRPRGRHSRRAPRSPQPMCRQGTSSHSTSWLGYTISLDKRHRIDHLIPLSPWIANKARKCTQSAVHVMLKTAIVLANISVRLGFIVGCHANIHAGTPGAADAYWYHCSL